MLNRDIIERFKGDIQDDNFMSVHRVISTYPEILQQTDPQFPGVSWLHVAAARGSLQVAKRLLVAGMLVDAQDPSQATPLSRAAALRGNVEMVRLLLNWGAHPDGPDGPDGGFKFRDVRYDVVGQPCRLRNSPLILAAAHNDTETLKLLVSAGANVLAVSFYSPTSTALDIAKENRSHAASEFLETVMQAERALLAVDGMNKSSDSNGIKPI